jgi:Family of unknown function (DUF7033)
MEIKPVKIFSSQNSPRLRFIADLIMNEVLGLSWEIITDKRKLGKFPVINYSDENVAGSFRISRVNLLFDKGISKQKIVVSDWNGLPVFFQSSEVSDMPFDIFAASFYMVSRYEEYLEFEPDEFGRFRSSDSLAFKNGFLQIPVVDLWAKELAKSLVKKFPALTFRRNEYNSLVTFDIDEAFAYLGKSLIANIAGFVHDISSGSKNASRRLNCLTKGEKDPYEVFEYIIESVENNGTETKFFFPVGDRSGYDKNPSWKNKDYRQLILRIANKFRIGLHPSFKASISLPLINAEFKRLKTISNQECRFSRFHFLRIIMPESYRNLSDAGVNEDYSMGYSDEPGFRAGIARSFRFYDVAEDKITDLRIFPFMNMDVTLFGYKKFSAEEAKEVIANMIVQAKKVGGLFISIWHNTSLVNAPEGRELRELFEFTLKEQMV